MQELSSQLKGIPEIPGLGISNVALTDQRLVIRFCY